MKGTQKSLLASGVALLASAALLAGTTFAWFTDSVVNTGNKIQAGNLSIGAYAYDLAEDGEGGFTIAGVNGGNPFKFETEGQDLKTDKNPIINDTLFEPGKSSAKLLKVENEGTLAAKIKVDFTVEDGGLMEALWFDFVKVENGAAVGSFTRRPMNTLETFAENLELPLLENGDNVQFILIYGMYESAGNAFKEKSFTADVAILATQYTKEEDGFGNDQYDKDASLNFVPVESEQGFVEALADVKSGDQIVLNQNISSEGKNLDFLGVADVEMDFAGHTVAVENDNIALRVIGSADNRASAVFSDGAISAGAGTYCTIGASLAEVTLNNMTLNNITPYGNSVKAFNGGVINLNNVQSRSEKGGAMEAAGGTINVNGGTFVQVGEHDWNSCLGAVSNNTGTLNVRDVTATGDNYGFYIFSSGGTINLYSGTFKAATVLKADLDLNRYPDAKGTINVYGGSFDGAIDINKNCTLNIEAGTFANTGLTLEQFRAYVAEGYKVVTEERADGTWYTVVLE